MGTKNLTKCGNLRYIVEPCAGAVGIDVVHFGRRHRCIVQCRDHCLHRTRRVWRGQLSGIGTHAKPRQLGINGRTPSAGLLPFFKHQDCGTFADHQPHAIL
jgi:hypothetical protein